MITLRLPLWVIVVAGFAVVGAIAGWVQHRVRIRVHRLRVAVVKPRLPS